MEYKMASNNMIHKRIGAAAITLVLLGFVTGLHAKEITLLTPKSLPSKTKVLSFPSGERTGSLYLEPESGPGWSTRDVRFNSNWEYLSPAQGDVRVPAGHIKLWIQLALSPQESAIMRKRNPQAHQLTIADRTRKDPHDLSGLLGLDPNDLFWLTVSTEMHLRTGSAPRIFEPIRHLTGLQMLTLHSAGITDEGLEHLRSLRSLRGLELFQKSIGNRSLAILKDLPNLEYLALNTGITDAGLKQVAQMSSLRCLSIMNGKMWGPGLAELARLTRLEGLCFWGASSLSDRHIKYLEGLTQLKGLTFNGADALTNTSLASIGKLKNLEELHFIRSQSRFTPVGTAHLKNLQHLKKIDFAQTLIGYAYEHSGDNVMRQLATNLPQLESIKGMCFLNAEGMKSVARFRNLKCLQVGLRNRALGYYGPTGVSHLAGLRSLEKLHLTGHESLSDADLASLESLSGLKDLQIFSIQNVMSERELASIGKLKRLERLYLSCPVTRSAINHLNGLSNLKRLHVDVHGPPTLLTRTADNELMLDLSGLKKMKDLHLSGLTLQDSDLAFLIYTPLLENLQIHSDSLTGAFLQHLRELPELNRLYIGGLSACTGENLAYLNGLPKLRSLHLTGDITNSDLMSLEGPLSLESLNVGTNHPIRKQTVNQLKRSHPVIEYIHINNEPMKFPTKPPQPRTRVNQPRTNRRSSSSRPRERR
jgi:hypothetical protein